MNMFLSGQIFERKRRAQHEYGWLVVAWLLAMAMSCNAVAGQASPRLRVEVEPRDAVVEVAQPLVLRVSLDADAGVETVWPDWVAQLAAWNVQVQSATPHATVLEVLSYLPGSIEMPALDIAVVDRSVDPPEHTMLQMPSRTITVRSVLAQDVDVSKPEVLRAVAKKLNAEKKTTLFWRWGGAALGLALLAGVVGFVVRRKRSNTLTPDMEVNQRLAAGDEPALVVRRYLARTFNLACEQQTAAEFSDDAAAQQTLGAELHKQLAAFFERASANRFAAQRSHDMSAFFDEAKKHVERARRIATGPSQGGPAA